MKMAQLQRWQLFGRLLLALLTFGLARGAGLATGWALLLAATVFWIHGLFMLAMFLGLRWINRGEPSHAGVSRLVRAWWRELRISELVFAWWQPFAEQAQPDFVPPDAAGRRGVVLLHGYTCNRGLWNGWMRRLREAGHPFVAPTLEPAFGSIDAYAGEIDAAVLRLTEATGLAPLIVAHSMGGLAARAWLRKRGDAGAAMRIVTLGTPHAGSLWARFAATENGRQMRRSGGWLAELLATEPAALPPSLDSVYSDCDHLVCPAGSAVLPGSRAQFVAGVGHLALLFEPQVFDHVLALLKGPIRPRP